ncbi:UxaA family hydrolase [Shewanella pealeana]|uniref:D-galactarate dehydratase/Altronate hydrolase domain protein n=1 Tax=Shewanella pealeana (strain ATCC 700345 / ANG-SQ1) TaxID=398579 RepID=A8H9C8_SHEPA|nr:UxaA family hydrolase [Shewanella pealeana]ABV89165.1 D-galactarate dehydratase/Altronate hydrolase domain protein [Shewanella pealeana ATCC 700345]
MMNSFIGFGRTDGSVGIRNHVLIMAVDECCDGIARAIADSIDNGIVVTNYNTCMYGGNEEMINTMIHTGNNPNVAGVLVLAMGCGSIDPEIVAAPIRETGRPAFSLVCMKQQGTRATINQGKELAQQLQQAAQDAPRVEKPISELIIGVKCGGSDTSSGIASNPSVGRAVDTLVDMGATAIAGELIELVGCESILRQRAVSTEVADKLERLIHQEEARWHVDGAEVETMSIGNSVGGLTTLEEKSFGALSKTGTRAIQDVLQINHLVHEKPTTAGFYLSEATHLCGSAGMHFAALGAHLILWTTGGAGFNNPIVPVIRVSGNQYLLNEDIDIDASGIMRAEEGVESVAERIVAKVSKVAQGQQTNIEEIGYSYCSLYQKDQRLETVLRFKPGC